MTMYVLFVEDDADFVDEIQEILSSLVGDVNTRVARSRDEAYQLLSTSKFLDLIILDLKIPTLTNALDADPEHGYAVFNEVRSIAPGTPIFILTGSPAEAFLSERVISQQEQADIWGEGSKTGVIRFLKKINIDKCPKVLNGISHAIEALSIVELERNGISLNMAEDRLIRIFCRKNRGRRCVISELSGGLSSARVMRLRITDDRGALVHDAVAKFASHEDIFQEVDNYQKHVNRLAPDATPRLIRSLNYGGHSLAGIFYGLAEEPDKSVFDVIKESDRNSLQVVQHVKTATTKWVADVPEVSATIRQVRQRLSQDNSFKHISEQFDLNWADEFESRTVQIKQGCAHGDLHGGNVLVSTKGVQLIDFGEVGPGPASLDPITLELSVLCHPAGPGKASNWPTFDQANDWGNLDSFLVNCPFGKFINECRNWARTVGAGTREVDASAYSYLIRQLRYKDTDKDLILALLEGVRKHFNDNT